MLTERARNLLSTAFNLLLLAAAGIASTLMHAYWTPLRQGFFCGDESISKPYFPNTISSTLAGAVGVTLPAIAIAGTELILWCRSDEGRSCNKRDMFCGLTMNGSIVSSLRAYLYFLNGMVFTLLLATSAHSLVGRLRPHFLDVCRPDWDQVDCNLDAGRGRQRTVYVTNYTCRGDAERFGEDAEAVVEDARKSFFSGHTSTAFASMTFVILYLQAKTASRSSGGGLLLVPFLQLLAFGVAFITAISRVTDNAHHPSDVVAGAAVGVSIQVLNVVYVQRLFSEENIRVGEGATTVRKCDETPGSAESIPMLKRRDENACSS